MTDRIPLICFPHAGAGKLYYSRWRFTFGDAVDLQIVEYPLREKRSEQPMPATVPELAAAIADEYAEVLRGPYAIWGHSMGSIIGYEVAIAAQRRFGSAPLVFFSSGASAPSIDRSGGLERLDAPNGLRNVLLSYGGLEESSISDPEFMRYLAPVIEADLRLLGKYRDAEFEQLQCQLVLIEGDEDNVTLDGWARYTDEPIDTHWFSGGHFFLDEHREAMAGLMEKRLQLVWQAGVVSV